MKPTYELVLGKTYYNKGFFNLGVSVDKFIRRDEGVIRIYLANTDQYIDGRAVRTANQNGTHRIFAGSRLRDWFFKNFKQNDLVLVVIEAPNALRIIAK